MTTPAKSQKKPENPKKRFLIYFAFSFFLGGLALLLANKSFRQTITESLPVPVSDASDAGDTNELLNIAILGVGGDNHDGGALADTVMLASIDPQNPRAVLFSIPRDLFLTLEDGSRMRINRALAPHANETSDDYGTRVKSVFASTFNMPVHHFVRLDFAAFVMAVDTVGGVDVHFEAPLYDTEFAGTHGVIDYPAGIHHLDGAAALHVARSRKTSSGGDLDRAARQRAILVALRDKLEAVDALASPTILGEMFEAQRQHVQTDLGIFDVLRLYNVSRDMNMGDVHTLGFENSPEPLLAHANIGGAAVLVPDAGNFAAIREYLHTAIAERLLTSGT